MKHIIFNNPNDPFNVVVITPAYNGIGESRTDEQMIEAIAAQAIELNLSGINDSDGYRIVSSDVLPSDHDCDTVCYLYNAWRLVDGHVVVDIPAARALVDDPSLSNTVNISVLEEALKMQLDVHP